DALAPQSWHHLAVVAGDRIALFVDGARAGSPDAPLPELSGNSLLGADAPSASPPPPTKKGVQGAPAAPPALPRFQGEVDELQIAKVDRPAGFIRLAAVGQGPDGSKMLVAGPEEQSGGWTTGYFAIILQSVTPDGWVVICLLAVMALVSWIVMASKASYLSRVERANGRFAAKVQESSADLAPVVQRRPEPGAAGSGARQRRRRTRHFARSSSPARRRSESAPMERKLCMPRRSRRSALVCTPSFCAPPSGSTGTWCCSPSPSPADRSSDSWER